MSPQTSAHDSFPPPPQATVDLAIFSLLDGVLQVLLVQRADAPHAGRWSLPGGYVDTAHDASLEATALRKLEDKTGVSAPYLEQVCTVGNQERDPRGWSITVLYMALIAHGDAAARVSNVSDARWWPWSDARQLPLAFDHTALLQQARERLRNRTAYTALPIFVLPAPFTLSALQQAFEALLDSPLEKKSFRRRMEEARLLEEADTPPTAGGRGRPAALYLPCESARAHIFSRVLGRSES